MTYRVTSLCECCSVQFVGGALRVFSYYSKWELLLTFQKLLVFLLLLNKYISVYVRILPGLKKTTSMFCLALN